MEYNYEITSFKFNTGGGDVKTIYITTDYLYVSLEDGNSQYLSECVLHAVYFHFNIKGFYSI